MVECVFTLDYEIFGDGTGSASELMYKPARKLKALFDGRGASFVLFVEVAELEILEKEGGDSALDLVRLQIREFHRSGVELGLHVHPWWYNARRDDRGWLLDYSEYNLC